MALKDLGTDWFRKAFRRRTVKNPDGVKNRRCANCGHEVSGVGPAPAKCSSCGEPWRDA